MAAVNTINGQISQSLEQHQKPSTIKTEKMVDEVQMTLNGIGELIWTLGLEQERLSEMVLLGQGNMGSAPLEELNTLKAQMKVLEACIPCTSNGRLGGKLFQSTVDVLLFIEDHGPSNSFHLFHDVVTWLESLTTSHVERKDVLQEWYQSTNVGVNEALA